MSKTTTIQISKDLREVLHSHKKHKRDSYEDVIWDLVEDKMELNEESLADIKQAQEEFKRGEFITAEALKKKFGIS